MGAAYSRIVNGFERPVVRLGGRMMTRRIMGKAAFINLKDMSGTIQIYVKRDELGEDLYEAFKHWDLGDILGVEGYVFRTRTGELSVHATSIRLLTKALRPLPEKWHGLTDLESRYRQRYVDLIVNDDSRRVFQIRSRAIEYIRRFFNERQFLEVIAKILVNFFGCGTVKSEVALIWAVLHHIQYSQPVTIPGFGEGHASSSS